MNLKKKRNSMFTKNMIFIPSFSCFNVPKSLHLPRLDHKLSYTDIL